MESGWHYHSNGQTFGPLSLEELCDELGRSRDWRDEVVWHSSLGKWTYAGAVFRLTLPRAEPPRQPAAPARMPGARTLDATILDDRAHAAGTVASRPLAPRSLDDDSDEPAPNRIRTALAVAGLAVLGVVLALLWRWLV